MQHFRLNQCFSSCKHQRSWINNPSIHYRSLLIPRGQRQTYHEALIVLQFIQNILRWMSCRILSQHIHISISPIISTVCSRTNKVGFVFFSIFKNHLFLQYHQSMAYSPSALSGQCNYRSILNDLQRKHNALLLRQTWLISTNTNLIMSWSGTTQSIKQRSSSSTLNPSWCLYWVPYL